MGDNDWYWHLLRITHIVSGTLWVGMAVFVAVFLEPTVREMGPDGGRVMQIVTEKRKLPQFFGILVALTIGAGVLLYWRDSGHLEWEWISESGPGIAYTLGGILAIIAGAIGMGIIRPAGERMSEIGQKLRAAAGPPDAADLAEMRTLQERLRMSARIVAVLLVITVVAMAMGRYLIV